LHTTIPNASNFFLSIPQPAERRSPHPAHPGQSPTVKNQKIAEMSLTTAYGGDERREGEQAWAEKILREELRRRWTDGDLKQRRKGDAQKLKLAQRLRRESTMTLTRVAQRLSMGAASSLANLPRSKRRK
jgi:hypothetical protein